MFYTNKMFNSNEFTCTMLPWLLIAVISVRQTSEKQPTYNFNAINKPTKSNNRKVVVGPNGGKGTYTGKYDKNNIATFCVLPPRV
jgi:hypothetical protein